MYYYMVLLWKQNLLLKNDERIPVWLNGYSNAIDKLQKADQRDRHSGSEMRVRNINCGVEG